MIWGIALSKARRPGSNLFIGSAMGTLGIGLPFAAAVKAARPNEPCFLFTGDGAFGMSLIELDTCARHGLGVVVVVVNNGGWGDVRHEQEMFYGEGAASDSPASTMRYDLIARGGRRARRTRHVPRGDPARARTRAARRPGPACRPSSTRSPTPT